MEEYNSYAYGMEQYYEKPGPIRRFFFACAGAYMKVLEACPSEHTKYVGIGATIFLTACMAVLSGSFAIHTLTSNAVVSVMFGLLWGALIFNLDRYIVSSMRKEGRFWYEFGIAAPRLILAVLISIVVTKPIEIELFRNQINAGLYGYVQQLEREAEAQLDHKLGLDSINAAIQHIDSTRIAYKQMKEGKPATFQFGEVSDEYNRVKSRYDSLYARYMPRIQQNETQKSNLWAQYATRIYETDRSGNRKFVRWDFPQPYAGQSEQLSRQNQLMQRELNQLSARMNTLEKERKDVRASYTKGLDEEIAMLQQQRDDLDKARQEREQQKAAELPAARDKARRYGVGFPAKIQALELMKKDDPSIWWMSNLIMMLFILLETSPVFVKLISKRGPYDYLLSRIEHHKKIEALRSISDMNYDLNATLRQQVRTAGLLNGASGAEESSRERS